MPNKQEEEVELRQTHDALSIILSDDTAFEAVLNAVFKDIDQKGDGTLDNEELERYIGDACTGMGLPPPKNGQVHGIFHQLDLNNDQCISREELGVFLRHFFQQQVKFCALKLHLPRAP
ncbi:Lysophosphatidylcholine acyltransferase 2 [Pleodorina starrii]|uniref:Lysophosphatidylcholine acyltransferase 2 n=1 Tax=Pleodorina starrii TaxID=330485 RepID=A0A9W6F2Q9_9CHLO|nr:Lysophosphatidylcholine acyltransferase 2 [Pleodorina starrii]GLC53640.1 Lysophosphatidylcholine acyltransferase 2 [Pleodorina starrii]GLC65663.1 Lysophosphatidylcholine acyltransferase 2 [Pleodorina starrii]